MRYVDTPVATPVSVIGLGTWQFGSAEWGYGEDYEQRTAALVRRALDSGITLFDTAEIYGRGRSERLLGAALGDRRPEAFVATKIFPVLPVAPVVEQRAVASAARLGVQRLDLYQVHQPNPVVRDTSTMPGMRALQDVGLVDQVGVSNYSLDRWRAAEDALGRPVLSNQVEYSLAHRGPEDDLLPYAAEHDRLVIAYSPLAQGLLSGRYSADNPPSGRVRRINPLFLPENLERAAPLLATLREVADAHDDDDVAGRARLPGAPPAGGRDPGCVERGAGRGQRRRRRRRAGRGRGRGARGGGPGLPAGHRAAGGGPADPRGPRQALRCLASIDGSRGLGGRPRDR